MSDFAKRVANFSPARLTLLCAELHSKLEALEAVQREPIAVVGMGCRLPGGVTDPESYWKLLAGAVDAVTEIPRDRWDVDAFYDPDPEAPGKMYCKHGAFLNDIDRFDPQFFNISPREAVSLDPQHRLLLETTWQALEDAGQNPLELRSTAAGVFVGIGADDYAKVQIRSAPAESITPYTGTGNAYCYGAGRLSFFLGIQGPCLPVDTACSSSLVAAHLACQSLRAKECNLAIVGGVHLMLSPVGGIFLSKARALAPDGRCKTFDARADGYTRGEGCGVLVLKRLSDALASGDRIHAVIRGSAVNHDGPSSGFTVPNGQAQQAVIKAALLASGVSPERVGYVEVHGTGTPLGDPIELRALSAVLGSAAGRSADAPLMVGSVKTNIGHLEPAAGIAGLMKLILALKKGAIPAHLHLQRINPHIDMSSGPLSIPTELTPWTNGEQPRCGAVSSFGLSGTNAHMIVEQAPEPTRRAAEKDRPLHVFMLSAKDESALVELARRHADHVECSEASLGDVCFTANVGRASFVHRLAIVAEDRNALAKQLSQFAEGERPRWLSGRARTRRKPKTAFLFTGQGAQYAGMAQCLYDTQPTFRRVLDDCASTLGARLPVPLLSVLYGSESSRLDQTLYTQPALFALEYALASMWRSWGVEPGALLGHSIGEYVAACLAGVFSLEEALDVVATRARLMQSLPEGGGMIAVAAPAARVEPLLASYSGKVTVAAYNGPDRIVLSGDAGALGELQAKLEHSGTGVTRLAVSHAFHSPMMDPILDEFEAKVASVRRSRPELKVISNLTGAVVGDELTEATYWREHLRRAVRFEQGVQTAKELGCDVFLEIGPKPVLTQLAQRCITDDEVLWLASVRPGKEWQELLNAAGALYVRGAAIDAAGIDRDYGRQRVSLPTYAFQRERYWLDLPAEKNQHTVEGERNALPTQDQGPLLLPESEAMQDPVLGPRLESLIRTCSDDGVMTINRRVTAKLVFFTSDRESAFFLNQKDRSIVVSIYLGTDENYERALNELAAYASSRNADLTIFAQDNRVPAHERLGFSTTPIGVWQTLPDLRTFSLKGGSAKNLRSKVNSYRNLGDVSALEYKAGTDPTVDRAIAALMDDWIARKGKKAPFEAFLKQQIISGSLDAGYRLFLVRRAAELDAVILLSPIAAKRGWVMDLEFYRAKMPSGALEFGIITILERLQAEGVFYYSLGATFGTQLGTHPNGDPKIQDLLKMLHDRSIMNGDGNYVFKTKFNPTATRFYVCRRHGTGSDDLPHVLAMLADPGAEPAKANVARSNGADRSGLQRSPEQPVVRAAREIGSAGPLVGRRVPLASDAIVHEFELHLDGELEFLRDHRIFGQTLIPAAAYVESIVGVVRSALGVKQPLLSDVILQAGLVVDPGEPAILQVVLEPDTLGVRKVRLCSKKPSRETWTTHVTAFATLAGRPARLEPSVEILAAARSRCVQVMDPTEFYTRVREFGIEYGQTFQNVQELFTTFGEALGRVRLRAPESSSGFALPPALIDACFQVHAAALLASKGDHAAATYIPVKFGRVQLHEALTPEVWSHVQIHAVEQGNPDLIVADINVYSPDGRLLVEFGGFEVRRTRAEAVSRLGSGVSDLFYGLEWQAQQRGSLGRRTPQGQWLIVADEDDVAARLAQRLEQEGHVCRRLIIDELAGSELLTSVRRRLSAERDPALPLRGVVHACRGRTRADDSLAALQSAQARAYGIALGLVQAMAADDNARDARLWLVTRGASSVLPGDDLAPEYAPVSGLGRTIAQEHPELWGGSIDLDLDCTEKLEALADEILASDGEDQVALRGDRRFVARVQTRELQHPQQPLQLCPDGTHLITGGLGALGLAVARWMVGRGARHLALMGRSGAVSEEARRTIADLEAAGARVAILQGDVARDADVSRVLQDIRANMPPLKGIMHAAGVLADGLLAQQTWNSYEAVAGPKVYGSWNLHAGTQQLALDYFVLFSSTASLFGAAGQGNYAAANAYMDALAAYRRARGLSAISISWGPWSEIGMSAAAGETSAALREAHGVRAITPEHGLQALERILAHGTLSHVGVVAVDWQLLLESSAAVRNSSLFKHLSANLHAEPSGGVVPGLLAAPEPARISALESYLCEQVGNVLRLAPSKIARDLPLTEMGFDSLMALELRQRIERDLEVNVPIVNLFRGDTLSEFAVYLLDELRKRHPESFSLTVLRAPAELLAQLDELSDEAVEALLKDAMAEAAS